VAELQKIYPAVTHIDVHPDAKLTLDACVVETEIGIVEASLTGQVETLREALSVVFEQKASEAEGDADSGGDPRGNSEGIEPPDDADQT
jgi:type III secretion protein L